MTEPFKLRVRDWAEEDRPREKLLQKGVNALSDAELLAIIIGSGSREETVVELAQRIFQSVDNNINRLGQLSINQLVSQFKGIGEAKAISIVAALELGKRRKASETTPVKIISSRDIFQFIHPTLCDLYYEEFWAIFLNSGNRLIHKMKVSQGGVSETIVDSKLIYKAALNCLATKVAICHNHPSGSAFPSKQDDIVTQRVKKGIEMLDMILLDHVIVCETEYFSYADEGRIIN